MFPVCFMHDRDNISLMHVSYALLPYMCHLISKKGLSYPNRVIIFVLAVTCRFIAGVL